MKDWKLQGLGIVPTGAARMREGKEEQGWRRHGTEGGILYSSPVCHSLGYRRETAVGSKETELIRQGRTRQVETAHPRHSARPSCNTGASPLAQMAF